MKKIFTPRLNGFILPNLCGIAIVAISKQIADNSGMLIFSEFIIVPMLMGIYSAWLWRSEGIRTGTATLYCLINTIITVGLCYLFVKEGYLCLIVVSPLLFGFISLGTFIGRCMFKSNNSTLNVSFIGLLIFIFINDSLAKHYYVNEVSDSIVINATPDKIWKNVLAFKRIKAENEFWLFRIGMPSPVESTVDGYYEGSGRKCIFSNGYIFDEKIITFDKNKNLTFDIVNQPKDPEIMRHIDIKRGQFILKDNGNGTTTLIGNSWYQLYVFPVWYYDRWAQSITRNVHLRVMDHIKELSEAK